MTTDSGALRCVKATRGSIFKTRIPRPHPRDSDSPRSGLEASCLHFVSLPRRVCCRWLINSASKHTDLTPGRVFNLEQGAHSCLAYSINTSGSSCQRVKKGGGGSGEPTPSRQALQSRAKAACVQAGSVHQNWPCSSSPGHQAIGTDTRKHCHLLQPVVTNSKCPRKPEGGGRDWGGPSPVPVFRLVRGQVAWHGQTVPNKQRSVWFSCYSPDF